MFAKENVCKQCSVDPCCFDCFFHVSWDSLCSDNIVFMVTDNVSRFFDYFYCFDVFNNCANWKYLFVFIVGF